MEFDLVFEGGGAKGMVFVGAMQAFAEAQHTYGRLIGTSAGAITAAALAAGYKPEEMELALMEQAGKQSVFATFMGDPPEVSADEVSQSAIRELLRTIDLPIPDFIENKLDDVLANAIAKNPRWRHLYAFIENGGWYSAHDFINWFSHKLDEGTFNGRPRNFSAMTLKEMFAATERELTLIASDITEKQLLVLNHRTAPKLPVVWAVRMSMSVPFIWNEVIWQEKWGTYRDQPMINHAVVDGGLLSNFPIELFVSYEPTVTAVMGPKRSENVLGFLIDERQEVPNAPAKPEEKPSPLAGLAQTRTLGRIRQLVDTLTQARDRMVIEQFEELVVRLPAKGFGTTEFKMDEARRKALVNSGHERTVAYLAELQGSAKSLDLNELEEQRETANQRAIDILSR